MNCTRYHTDSANCGRNKSEHTKGDFSDAWSLSKSKLSHVKIHRSQKNEYHHKLSDQHTNGAFFKKTYARQLKINKTTSLKGKSTSKWHLMCAGQTNRLRINPVSTQTGTFPSHYTSSSLFRSNTRTPIYTNSVFLYSQSKINITGFHMWKFLRRANIPLYPDKDTDYVK